MRSIVLAIILFFASTSFIRADHYEAGVYVGVSVYCLSAEDIVATLNGKAEPTCYQTSAAFPCVFVRYVGKVMRKQFLLRILECVPMSPDVPHSPIFATERLAGLV